MAKYKGIVWSDARGKINGLVYSRNTFGVYVRNFASPTQPRTTAQQNMRAILQNLSRSWRNLTPAQRSAWSALAAQVILTDTLGNSYHPTGQQLFVGLNTNLSLIGASTITTPPATPVLVNTPTNVYVTATGGTTPALTVGWDSGNATLDAIIYATSTISAGRKFIRPSEFRIIGNANGAGTPATSILSLWQQKYGPPPNPAAGKVAVGIKLVDSTTGFAGGFIYGVDTW